MAATPPRTVAGVMGAAILALVVAACGAAPSSPSPSAAAASTTPVPDWREDPREPYPFVTPVPPVEATPVDGVYVRVPTDPYEGQRVPCRRCPPYPLDRGVSRLSLVAGRFEMLHEKPAYRIIGHYTVSGDELALFNDPECSQVVGTYRWSVADETLTLEPVDDPCAFGQRSDDFSAVEWTRVGAIPAGMGCEPPGEEAAFSGHWPVPSGC